MKEELLEPLLRKMRIARIIPTLKKFPNCKVLDVGCGWNARFLCDAQEHFCSGIGIDFKAPAIQTKKIQTFAVKLQNTLPFEDKQFDVVTMLAVLEHLDEPEAVLKEIHRVLRPGGILTGTVPSKLSKPVLEFLSFKLGIVNPLEISDHKAYYDKKSLHNIMKHCGFAEVKHNYFQFGMNNYFAVNK